MLDATQSEALYGCLESLRRILFCTALSFGAMAFVVGPILMLPKSSLNEVIDLIMLGSTIGIPFLFLLESYDDYVDFQGAGRA